MAMKGPGPLPVEPREFRSPDEIGPAIAKLQRRVADLKKLDLRNAYTQQTGADAAAMSDVRETIRDVFGPNSPEFHDHQHISLWQNAPMIINDSQGIYEIEKGRTWVIGILEGLIGRLEEKRVDLASGAAGAAPSTYFDRLNLHPRIRDVARDLFVDGHTWPAVFEAAKALVNYVKERSSRHDLDGANLMRTVFSPKNPILVFNDLADQTDQDEQEGMMHMFEGAVQAIRNPGGHSFPEGPEQRAIEYISFLSLLAYRLQDAKRRK